MSGSYISCRRNLSFSDVIYFVLITCQFFNLAPAVGTSSNSSDLMMITDNITSQQTTAVRAPNKLLTVGMNQYAVWKLQLSCRTSDRYYRAGILLLEPSTMDLDCLKRPYAASGWGFTETLGVRERQQPLLYFFTPPILCSRPPNFSCWLSFGSFVGGLLRV